MNYINNILAANKPPFMIRFNSDNYEFTGPMDDPTIGTREAGDGSPDTGFRLAFAQDNSLCFTPQ